MNKTQKEILDIMAGEIQLRNKRALIQTFKSQINTIFLSTNILPPAKH